MNGAGGAMINLVMTPKSRRQAVSAANEEQKSFEIDASVGDISLPKTTSQPGDETQSSNLIRMLVEKDQEIAVLKEKLRR